MAPDGRTVWWAKDAAWWRRERVVALGTEFGADGPAVVDWLACEAKSQNAGGWVKTGRNSVARGCFVDVVTVGHILSRAVTLGLLDEFSEPDDRFLCRMSGWQSDQDRAMAAKRKAESRARALENTGDPGGLSRSVPPGHRKSRPVTESPLTGQDRLNGSELRSDPVGGDSAPDEQPAEEHRRRQPSRRVDQAQLPADFPAQLAPVADQVLEALTALYAERGGIEPTLRGVGLAIARFPDRDHHRVLVALQHWATAGRGQNRKIGDWPRTYATFLDGTPPGAPSKAAATNASGKPETEYDRRRAERNAALRDLSGLGAAA